MTKATDLTGQTFGYLTVNGRVESMNGRSMWACVCTCGRPHVVLGDNLKRGRVKSCGNLECGVVQRGGDAKPPAAPKYLIEHLLATEGNPPHQICGIAALYATNEDGGKGEFLNATNVCFMGVAIKNTHTGQMLNFMAKAGTIPRGSENINGRALVKWCADQGIELTTRHVGTAQGLRQYFLTLPRFPAPESPYQRGWVDRVLYEPGENDHNPLPQA